MNANEQVGLRGRRITGMSYKFQRLRERLREAIRSGDLSGKLPGERLLAERFNANAKTLSKALTDLAAEGLLERVIGRGTFVKGQIPPSTCAGKWLLVSDAAETASALLDALKAVCPACEVITDVSSVRPSFLNQFSSVAALSADTPESFLRDLAIRNIPLVLVNREPATFSLNAALVDVSLAGARLARDLLLAGHRRLGAVEPRHSSVLTRSIRQAAAPFGADAVVETFEANETAPLLESGVTALVCASPRDAVLARQELEKRGAAIPAQISLTAVGCHAPPFPCSGYFVEPLQLAETVIGLLRDGAPTRPSVLWLAGKWHDAGTVTAGAALTSESRQNSMRVGMVV